MKKNIYYKFNIGDIVKHKYYDDIYGEIIERGNNPATNYYRIKTWNGFTARYDEKSLFIDIVSQRMSRLEKLGI